MEESLSKEITPATDGVVIDNREISGKQDKSVYNTSYGCQ